MTKSEFVRDIENILHPPEIKPESKVIFKQDVKVAKKHLSKQIKKVNGVPFNPNAIKNREELIIGKEVKHRVFGTGMITKIEGESIHLTFANQEKVLSIPTCLEMGLIEAVN